LLLKKTNAWTGLRALAVVRVLSSDYRLQGFHILPLSAAQVIDRRRKLTSWDNSGRCPRAPSHRNPDAEVRLRLPSSNTAVQCNQLARRE
jgi:hypothetical protein